MLNVDDYLQIRLLHWDGVSVRQIARQLGHGRDTVKKALVEATPRGYTRTRPATCPKLGAFTTTIDQILAEDRAAPRKQRHTAYRIFERLRDEHQYLGGYDQVRRYVSSHRKREREKHLLLDHPPGCRMECDFGHIQVDFPEGRRQVPVLIGIWSYSHYPFAIALPDERCGSILHGTLCAFEFFGCVPAELWWDTAGMDAQFAAQPLARLAAAFQADLHQGLVEARRSPGASMDQVGQFLGEDMPPAFNVVAEESAR